MEVVMKEELRGRSATGRELVEGEEAVTLVVSGEFDRMSMEGARDFITPPETAASPVSARALHRALDSERAIAESDAIQRTVEEAMARARARARAHSARRITPAGQPCAEEFLGRPYHEVKRSRFLFCEASEDVSYSNNRARGWDDSEAFAQLGIGTRQNGPGPGHSSRSSGGRGGSSGGAGSSASHTADVADVTDDAGTD